jgi:hypothetical protein
MNEGGRRTLDSSLIARMGMENRVPAALFSVTPVTAAVSYFSDYVRPVA